MAFETLIFVIAISFLRIALVKERAESRNRLAAETDQLTGAFNRRAFFDTGLRAVKKAEAEKQNCTLVLIDLDEFIAAQTQIYPGGQVLHPRQSFMADLVGFHVKERHHPATLPAFQCFLIECRIPRIIPIQGYG